MNFIGGGAKDGQQWLDFLGQIKDKRLPPIGSPFQIDFDKRAAEGGIEPMDAPLPSCGDAEELSALLATEARGSLA